MTTTVVLIRHAQTDSNVAGPNPRISGWADLPLNAVGQQQLARLSRRFTGEPPMAALYSSPLQRARATAAAISAVSAVGLDFADDLREINCGAVDGESMALVQKNHAGLWQDNLRQDNDDFRWPAGESYREFRVRCVNVIGRIVAMHEGGRVVVVTHAGVISQVLGSLHGFRPANWEPFRPENTSLSELRWENGYGELIAFNDHRHLA